MELGLAPVTRLLDRLDHPERDLPAIHVTGTNGKGSTCAMIAAQLGAAGLRVGLLTSPHLVNFHERIRVDGAPILDEEAVPILSALQQAGAYDGSFFEVSTALAFEHFRRRGVDVAVLEVGLGGRLDATNVCFPQVTAITTIDFDHTAALGNDLASIAVEKAGIIKPGVPVVLGPITGEARDAIATIAARRGAPVVDAAREVATRLVASSWDGLEVAVRFGASPSTMVEIPLPGRHQLSNLQVALAAARTFVEDSTAHEVMSRGLADTFWPGRLERVRGKGPWPTRVYDVAHNAGGAKALATALDELKIPEGTVLVIGVLEDKDLASIAAELSRHFRRAVTLTPPHPVRSRAAADTAAVLRGAGIEATPAASIEEAVETAVALAQASEVAAAAAAKGRGTTLGASEAPWVFVTGSLFTVGAVRKVFGDPA